MIHRHPLESVDLRIVHPEIDLLPHHPGNALLIDLLATGDRLTVHLAIVHRHHLLPGSDRRVMTRWGI
jgi:hypothetical protein